MAVEIPRQVGPPEFLSNNPEANKEPYLHLEQEDEDICDVCHRRNLDDDPNDMFWVGCDYTECGKWYHTKCVKLTKEEYYQIQTASQDWFCKEECKQNAALQKRNMNSKKSNKKK